MASTLQGLQASIERVILDPRYHDLLSIVKGARNGAVYGTKVRFPHALVMILLFRSGTLREKLALVLRATRTHARNLATFAAVYKATCVALKHLGGVVAAPGPGGGGGGGRNKDQGKEGPYDALVAGLLGGYVVFGRRGGGGGGGGGRVSSVNQQIVVYVFARVVLALARLAVPVPVPVPAGAGAGARSRCGAGVRRYAWPVFASASWGLVMWLFRHHPEALQPSLRSSMAYIYAQSDEWDSLRNFVWHNK